MYRISSLASQLALQSPVLSSIDYLGFTGLSLTEEEEALRLRTRTLMEGLRLQMIPFIDEARFPQPLVEVFKQHGLGKYYYKGKYGVEASEMQKNVLLMEIARVDASLATFFMIHHRIVGRTIELYGSEEQKEYYLPKIRDFEIIGGWGLTERNIGSDASGIETTVTEAKDGRYILSGNKRWIGMADRDFMVVFANNRGKGVIEAFIVDLSLRGVTRHVLKHKLPLRPVQNMQVDFDNVVLEARCRLPKVQGFASVAQLLTESRMCVCWLATGMGVGAYDYMMRYISERKQFGRSLMAFQLMQNKVARVMSGVQSCLVLARQLTRQFEQGKATMGQIALAKGFITATVREVAGLAREALGGNGLLLENQVIKVVADIEAIYTYEGTYDVNTMIAARELTGVAAFKTR